MAELNNIKPQQNNTWTKKQIIAQNAVMAACAVPVSTICYEINCGAKPQPRKKLNKNITMKEFCIEIAEGSKKGIAKLLNKLNMNNLSEKYLKIGNKSALVIEGLLQFSVLFGFFSLFRRKSKD